MNDEIGKPAAGVGDASDRVTVSRVVERPPELRPSLGSARPGGEVAWLLDEGRRQVSLADLLPKSAAWLAAMQIVMQETEAAAAAKPTGV